MVYECKECNCKFVSKQSLDQHGLAKHSKNTTSKKVFNFKKYLIFTLIALILIFASSTIYSNFKKPGKYDDFTKCLTDKGAIMYGNTYCSYTGKQLNFFGKSGKYLNYVKCAENQELCDTKGVRTTPTWEINGEMYPQIQTFEQLSELTGCEY